MSPSEENKQLLAGLCRQNGISRDMVRIVLRKLQSTGDVECLGRGPGARWRRREKGNTLIKGNKEGNKRIDHK